MEVKKILKFLSGNDLPDMPERANSRIQAILSKKYNDVQDEIRDLKEVMNRYETDPNEYLNKSETKVQQFYTGSIFITGGTGFLGKTIIEKLLRTCDGITNIYFLIRPKKGKDAKTRLQEVFDELVFSRLKKEKPNSLSKIIPIYGDASLPGLGLSASDRKLIINEVSIIFHGAATVRFDEKLKYAVDINVKGVKAMCELASECPNLRSFVHISTAFAHCNHRHIGEEVFTSPIHYEKLIEITETHTDEELVNISTEMLQRWKYPNTYCLTKAIAENCVKELAGHLPVCIHRPAIVISTYQEPVRGWIDNLYGPTGALVGAGTGFLRVMRVDPDARADVVPVDYVVNSIIVAAYQTSQNHKPGIEQTIPVYNYVPSPTNAFTWGRLTDVCACYGVNFPSVKAIWYYCLFRLKSKFWTNFLVMVLHIWPAFFTDIVLSMVGSKMRLMKLYKNVIKFSAVIAYFSTQQWQFDTRNVQKSWDHLSAREKRLYAFDAKQIDWDAWGEVAWLGARITLLEDDLSTLPQARKSWNRFYVAHQLLRLIFYGLVFWIIWTILCLKRKYLF